MTLHSGKLLPSRPVRRLLAALAALSVPLTRAQTATQMPPPVSPAAEQAIRLDPFEVKTSNDTSYGALNSNSITRFNTELDKTPVSADIFTKNFMDDVDATTVNEMLYTYGSMGAALSNPSADAIGNQPGDRVVIGDRFTPQQFSNRGLSAGNIRLDGFEGFPTSTATSSNFDIERIDVLEGPEGLLYGAGGAGGTIVATTKRAYFDQNSGEIYFATDQYGSKRSRLDVNAGSDNFALRVALVDESNQTRRINIDNDLYGAYTQFAVKVPKINTTLRVEGEYTYSLATLPNIGTNVQFGGTAKDPRSGDRLDYLLATNQVGAINPATGTAFPGGAIDNGNVNWSDYASFGGWRNSDLIQNYRFEATADTRWTSWFSTNVGCYFNRDTDRSDTWLGNLNAPLQNSNPLNNWAVGSNMQDVLYQQLYKNFRASGLVTHNFWDDRIKSQTSFGFDTYWRGYGAIDDGYFVANPDGSILVNPATVLSSNLGRTAIPNQYWAVDNGPILYPLVHRGANLFVSPQTGVLYARGELDPRSPAWISPGNPLGDANLYETTPTVAVNKGLSGIGQGGYAEQVKVWGYYAANYTSWFDDWIDTLVGFRMTRTHTHIPNGSSNIYGADYVQPSAFRDPSYNLGLDGRISRSLNWLRWYGDLSATYNDGVGQDDPIGNPPPPTYSHGWEAGLKFTPLQSRISGSIAYYYTDNENDNINYGGSIINAINPQGINPVYTGPAGRNSFVNLDDWTSGVQLKMTAQIKPNWRMRITATEQDGRILSTKRYGIIYNDQFYTDSKGGVTYADGTPFLVPVNATLVSKLAGATNPATILTSGVASQQLTTAMLGDPTNPYYAWGLSGVTSGAPNPQNTNGQLNSGLAGTTGAPAGLALRYFTLANGSTAFTGKNGLPISTIQYAYAGPTSVLVAQAGDKTTGYPVYSVVVTNTYEIPTGWFRGVGFVTTAIDNWDYRTYYYLNPDQSRNLFNVPGLGLVFNQNIYYQRKIGRVVWRTQLDVQNVFNRYKLVLAPNNGTGFTNPANIAVFWQGQPRLVSWSNRISF